MSCVSWAAVSMYMTSTGNWHESCYFLFEGESMHVTIINEEERCGCMLLEKRIADADGNLVMPSYGESLLCPSWKAICAHRKSS